MAMCRYAHLTQINDLFITNIFRHSERLSKIQSAGHHRDNCPMNISNFAQVAFQAGYIAAEFDFVSSPTECPIYPDLLALSPDSGTVLAAAWMRGYKRRCDEDAVMKKAA
jgi:hypothetical protein